MRGGSVLDRDDERVAFTADQHVHVRTGRVAQRVGQALLDDVAGGLHRGRRQALALALEPQRDREPAARCAGDELLHEREVGRGGERAVLTEIADRLMLGENTVKTHVARVLRKLGLRDRTQAVVVAYESGLITPEG